MELFNDPRESRLYRGLDVIQRGGGQRGRSLGHEPLEAQAQRQGLLRQSVAPALHQQPGDEQRFDPADGQSSDDVPSIQFPHRRVSIHDDAARRQASLADFPALQRVRVERRHVEVQIASAGRARRFSAQRASRQGGRLPPVLAEADHAAADDAVADERVADAVDGDPRRTRDRR